MTRTPQHDALMIRYLLGSATDAEQLQLEEQFFQDDDAYLEIQAVESELRYEYAQGGLSSEQRKQFEARFLKTAEDRRKVELAGSVLGTLSEMHVETRQPKRSWFAALFASPRFSFAASAAALLIVTAGSWFALDSMRLRQEIASLEQRQKQIATDAQQQVASAKQELDQERARVKEPVKQNPPAIFGFLLAPGLTRAADGIKRLAIPAGTADVAIELDVKAKGNFTTYRAELQDLDGTTLWSGKVSQPSVAIPARILKPGDYVVMLKGAGASGALSEAGEFYFRVVPR